jgi:hypothetical protein
VRRFRKTAQQTAATNARQISGLGPKERQRLSPGRPALTQLSSLSLGVFVVKWLLCLGGEVGTALLWAHSVRPYTHLIALAAKKRQEPGSGWNGLGQSSLCLCGENLFGVSVVRP